MSGRSGRFFFQDHILCVQEQEKQAKAAWFPANTAALKSKLLLNKFKHNRQQAWGEKQGQVTQEAHRHDVQACRDGVRKSKAYLELKMTKDVKGRAITSTLAVNGRKGKMCLCFWMRQRTWWQRTQRYLRFSVPSSSTSSPGPVLFNLFSNDLDTEWTLIKFEIKCITISGDTKLRSERDQMVVLSFRETLINWRNGP